MDNAPKHETARCPRIRNREMDNFQQNTSPQQQNLALIDYGMLIAIVLRLWYVFLIANLLALLIASIFNKYSVPVYKVIGTGLLQDPKKVVWVTFRP